MHCKHRGLSISPELVKMAVQMPTTRPERLSSGPPLLPGFSAASVWIPPPIVLPVRLAKPRPSELTTPAVRGGRVEGGASGGGRQCNGNVGKQWLRGGSTPN